MTWKPGNPWYSDYYIEQMPEEIVEAFVTGSDWYRVLSLVDKKFARRVFITRKTFEEIMNVNEGNMSDIQLKIENILHNNII